MVGFGNPDALSNSPMVGIINTGIHDIYLYSVDDVDPSVLSRKPVCRPSQYKGCSQNIDLPIILAAGLVTGVVASAALLYVGCLMCMDDGGNKRAKAAEWNAVQSAIDTFMAETVLTEITPSASGVGGEKINGTGTQFHAPLELNLYLRDLPSTYCYRWRSSGLIIAQYSVNSEGNCVIDAD